MCSCNILLHTTDPMEAVNITEDIKIIEAEEDVAPNVDEIGEMVVVDGVTVI